MGDLSALSSRDKRLLRVCQHVAEDLTRRPTLGEVAELAGVERTYFCRVFRDTVGMRFSDWSRGIRIDRAKWLLSESALAITVIAGAVGYSDITTFERNFRKTEGLAPLRYRQLHRRRPALIVTTNAEKFTTDAETPLARARSVERDRTA
jgi:transcriptional regulator GlxA family with amidase domain